MTTMRNTQRSKMPTDGYDKKLDQRVAKHEYLRDRNNVTTCRSPARQNNIDWKRTELQRKRQEEFLKRRQIDRTVAPLATDGHIEKEAKAVLRVNAHKVNPLDRRSLVMAEDLGITWPDVNSIEQAPWMKPIAIHSRENKTLGKQVARGDPCVFPLRSGHFQLERLQATRERGTQTQDGVLSWHQPQWDANSQTESGLITIRESDLIQMADYLQEALWREENLKQKLSILQQRTSTLLLYSDKLWMTRCNEHLTRSRIEALESQLEVCTQKFRRDGLKKLVLQMEEQKQMYQEKALEALQKAIDDRMEAEKKAESLEEALKAAVVESERWKALYQKLKESSEELRGSQQHTTDKLHQLQSELERAKGQEAELKHQLWGLQQEGAELRSQINQLEDDNQVTLELLQEMRGKLWKYESPSLSGNFFQSRSHDGSQAITEPCISESQLAQDQSPEAVAEIKAQLQDAQQKLTLKDKECTDLRAELEALEHECHTCLFRLTQCREELRRLNARRSQSGCCSWLSLCLFLAIALATLAVVLFYHPFYGDHLQEVCQTLRQRLESYLRDAALPRYSGCYRPV